MNSTAVDMYTGMKDDFELIKQLSIKCCHFRMPDVMGTHTVLQYYSTPVFYKQLASLLVQKQHQLYSNTVGWLQTTLSFALLKSTVLCLQGCWARRSLPESSDNALD